MLCINSRVYCAECIRMCETETGSVVRPVMKERGARADNMPALEYAPRVFTSSVHKALRRRGREWGLT